MTTIRPESRMAMADDAIAAVGDEPTATDWQRALVRIRAV